MNTLTKKLKSILVRKGVLESEKAEEYALTATEEKRSLATVLDQAGVVSRKECLGHIAWAANMTPVDLDQVKPNPDALESVQEDLAKEYGVLPLDKVGDVLTIAVGNPFDVLKLDDIRIITGSQLRPVVALEEGIKEGIETSYQSEEEVMEDVLGDYDGADVELKDDDVEDESLDLSSLSDEGSPVVKLVNMMISKAVKEGVSDIHIEPYEKRVKVRYRKDGVLVDTMQPPKKMQQAITSRIKIMSSLDIAEKMKPQDGKFQIKMEGRAVDFRVSMLPVVYGEKVVMRILDGSNLALNLNDLGFEKKCLKDYAEAILKPYGMILVTGPTGSGKSTTLYSAVKEIAKPDINLVTVEDPVEYTMEGINQVPVNPKRGLTFAAALRSILRQDPDVILLGEIRDKETIEIAVKAALTGHLVLSTLHTNDAPSTVTRMIDMGLDPFMVASSAILVCAQRLGRKLCEYCREPIETPPAERLLNLGFKEEDITDDDADVPRRVSRRVQESQAIEFNTLLEGEIGCDIDELEERGYKVISAGTMDVAGAPASDGALVACHHKGVDIGNHVSQPLTGSLVEASDFIFCMTESHCERVRSLSSSQRNNGSLLAKDSEIPDPIGQSQEFFNKCADIIEAAIRARVGEFIV